MIIPPPDDELRRLSDDATPGDWGWLYYDGLLGIVTVPDGKTPILYVTAEEQTLPWVDVPNPADAELIVAAVNYVRQLLAANPPLPSPPAPAPYVDVGRIMPQRHVPDLTNWVPCDGREVSRDTPLFKVIRDRYGPGNGSTTMNVPDTRPHDYVIRVF